MSGGEKRVLDTAYGAVKFESDLEVEDPPMRTPLANSDVEILTGKAVSDLEDVAEGQVKVTFAWGPPPHYVVSFDFVVDKSAMDLWQPGASRTFNVTSLMEGLPDTGRMDPLESRITSVYFHPNLFGELHAIGDALLISPPTWAATDGPRQVAKMRVILANCSLPLDEDRSVWAVELRDEPESLGRTWHFQQAAAHATAAGCDVVIEALGPWNVLDYAALALGEEPAADAWLDADFVSPPRPEDVWVSVTGPGLGHAVSTVVEITAKEHVMTPADARHWAESIRWFFTLSSAKADPVIRIDEIENSGDLSAVRWFVPGARPGDDAQSWWPRQGATGSLVGATIAEIALILASEHSEQRFEQAVSWYVGAVEARDPRSRLVMAQAALELLAWVHLVVDSDMSADGFERLPASDKIRLLLHASGLPTDLPSDLYALEPQIEGKRADAPVHVATARNRAVHPPRKVNSAPIEEERLQQSATLAVALLEGVLRRRIGWDGPSWDRIAEADSPAPAS